MISLDYDGKTAVISHLSGKGAGFKASSGWEALLFPWRDLQEGWFYFYISLWEYVNCVFHYS